MADTWNPKQYEVFKKERSLPFFDLVALLEPRPTPTIIDLGCGTGELTKALHECFSAQSTIGIDSSPTMLQKAELSKIPHLRFEKGQIENFLEPNRFDIIFSNAALQWCSDHRRIFKNCFASLKAGGQLAIQMPMNFDHPTHEVAARIAHTLPFSKLLNKNEPSSRSPFKPEEYSHILFELGFKRQNVLLKVYPHLLPSREAIVEWVKGTLLTFYESQLTVSDFALYLEAYQEELFNVLPDQKPFFYPFKRLLIWAARN